MLSLTNYFNPRNTALSHIEDHFDKLFDSFFSSNSLNSLKSRSKLDYPKVDVLETDKEYVVEAAVPGVNPDDLKVELSKELDPLSNKECLLLTITGKIDQKYQYPEQTSYYSKEIRRRQFTRQIMLRDGLSDNPLAEHENGILRLSWKKEPPPPLNPPKLISITKK